jgi:DNA-binding FadR family transcriptional regulator
MQTQCHSSSPNAAERIARELTVGILRGEFAPGTRLPTVRALAQRFGVNPSTIQRALARLEGTGLIDVGHGSGTLVLDPEQHADLSLLPEWLLARLDTPAEAKRLLSGYLELRRQLAARQLSQLAFEDWARFEPLLASWREAAGQGVDAFAAADVALFRALTERKGGVVFALVFNTAARLFALVPEIKQAMYAAPEENLARFAELMPALPLAESARDREVLIEDVLAEVDARTLRRFGRLVRRCRKQLAS